MAPLVIAHRGASGYLPEHTLPAKALAHGQGADYLEQDVVATRDGELLVFHDLYLDALTDVRERFPGRARPDGRHYCIDFDLAEIRTLGVRERRNPDTGAPRFPGRFPVAAGSFGIVTLEEELAFVQGLNRSTGRVAGLYPEIKEPAWHRQHGIDVGTRLIETLARFGYTRASDPVFVQCFDADELQRLHTELRVPLRLVQLVEAGGKTLDEAALSRLAGTVDALGADLRLLLDGDRGQGLAAAARRAGLQVHAWTVRSDQLPTGFTRLGALLDALYRDLRVDGIFTDFPDQVRAYCDRLP
ncbi:MAG: glycerophosphodiester phosphodiesterase [Chromatiales bacterium]|jgi:glycerophosphoryl diester phosphodiesterase|nr:glycerophosphodiester phosphodiesterase [Chromatiales bacterium]